MRYLPAVAFSLVFSAYTALANQAEQPELERGCCIFSLPNETRCVPSTKEYCKQKAKTADIAFEFRVGKSCTTVPACPRREE